MKRDKVTWFLSDLHFGHYNAEKNKGIITFGGRNFTTIEEHDKIIIDRWNERVRPTDDAIILGDFSFGPKENVEKYAAALNGRKFLILGNHDTKSVKYSDYFYKVFGCVEYKNAILTHIPVHESQLRRFPWSIHGHVHETSLPDYRYINTCVEMTEYYPVAWSTIQLNMEIREKSKSVIELKDTGE